jgi:Flp pilus assembly protein TadG
MDRLHALARIMARPTKSPLPRAISLKSFWRDQEGSLLILSIFIFLTMVVTSALTLDFMRQEEVRQRIQNTADRAALAAADLNQVLSPAEVVKDYFEKEGLSGIDYDLVVNENTYGTSRTVTITADTKVNRTFADFVAPDIRDLPIKINTQAEESIGRVEISLVLDISGSMDRVPSASTGTTTRLQRLVPAAQSFVSQMFDVVQPEGAEPGRLMMSIVPYSTQVALPDYMLDAYTVSNDYSIINSSKYRYEQCVDFDDNDFSSLSINPDTELQRTMYGDSWNYTRYVSSKYYSSYYKHYLGNCSGVTANQVMPYSNSETKLLAKIAGLDADGNTSIDFGVKWGLALLDPVNQLAMTRMISSNDVDSVFAGRPTEYGEDADAMKVLVVMTDGANTDAYSTKPEYRSGKSPIVSLEGTDNFDFSDTSTYAYYDKSKDVTGGKPYYNFSTRKWVAATDFQEAYTWTAYCYNSNGKLRLCTYTSYKQATFYDVSYEHLYQTKGLNLFGLAYYFAIPYDRTILTQYELMSERSENNAQSNETQKDDNLHAICDLAREKGIFVFTIAVDPLEDGYDYSSVLTECATTSAYAFSVDSDQMTTAFSTIVSNINALRLSN